MLGKKCKEVRTEGYRDPYHGRPMKIRDLMIVLNLDDYAHVVVTASEVFHGLPEWEREIAKVPTEKSLKGKKAFFAPVADRLNRCDKCLNVIEKPCFRSVFWVSLENSVVKFHCRACEKKAKEVRRRLANWYWKDDGAHHPMDFAKRAVFTSLHRDGKTEHVTVEELGEEFDKPLY